MKRFWLVIAAWASMQAATAHAQNVTVEVDTSAADAVLGAVRNPHLTTEQALSIARLPGNQGLIRKAKSYGVAATDDLFAKALVAAAHGDSSYVDVSRFQFDSVREHAAQTEQALAGLRDPKLHLLGTVKARIARFTPPTLTGHVTGYMVAGGTSGGFAFGEPRFYLDVDRYRSAPVAATIMSHELFHAVQALAQSAAKVAPGEGACVKGLAHGADVADYLGSLSAEGTASYVGDVLSLPEQGADEIAARERTRFVSNLNLVGRSVTLLELSVHGLTTGAAVSPGDVYELGFYGDEVMYALGYAMASAIGREEGDRAIGELIGLSGAAFVDRYVHLKSYGRSEQVPALKAETILWAKTLVACGDTSRPTGTSGSKRG